MRKTPDQLETENKYLLDEHKRWERLCQRLNDECDSYQAKYWDEVKKSDRYMIGMIFLGFVTLLSTVGAC